MIEKIDSDWKIKRLKKILLRGGNSENGLSQIESQQCYNLIIWHFEDLFLNNSKVV